MKNLDVFCPLPWNHISTTSSGSYRLCCNSDELMNRLSDEEGKTPKIYRESFSSVRNTELLRDVRSTMKSGEKPEVCRPCYEDEAHFGYSPRLAYVSSFKLNEVDVLERTKEDGTIESNAFPVQYIDIRLGNLCNLRCRMCNSWSSSSWNQEAQDIFKSENVGLMDWPSQKKEWIKEVLSHSDLQELYLTGGEPTLIEENIELLKRLKDLGMDEVRIKINSNLVFLSPAFIKALEGFKNVLFKCSIDSLGAVNDYIRFPSSFNEIKNNLDLVRNKFSFEIQSTIQVYNIFSCAEWILWCRNSIGIAPDFYSLREPKWLDIRSMNPAYKAIIKKNIEERSSMLLPEDLLVLNQLLGEVGLNYDTSIENDFKKYTKAMDNYRKQSVSEFIPELSDL
jgi:hypothetical protein